MTQVSSSVAQTKSDVNIYFPQLTPYERENMRAFFAHPHSRNYPNDPRALFGVYESRFDHFRYCQLPQREPILIEIAMQAREVLSQWRARRFGKEA